MQYPLVMNNCLMFVLQLDFNNIDDFKSKIIIKSPIVFIITNVGTFVSTNNLNLFLH